jgi:UDP-N-acetylmuramate-alanine ligase
MLIAGIIGHEGKSKTAILINSFFASTGKRVSIIDAKSLVDLGNYRVKSYISELDKNNIDILILKIELKDIEKEIFNNIHFDIMIYIDKADDLKEIEDEYYKDLVRKNFSLLDDKGIAIVNIDDNSLLQMLHGLKNYIVTYGFNSKASITTSSIGDIVSKENFMCCLQRTISTKNGVLIEPQEYSIKIETTGMNSYNVLAAATFAIVNGVDLNSAYFNSQRY